MPKGQCRELLASMLGMELEIETVEQNVGLYRADILCGGHRTPANLARTRPGARLASGTNGLEPHHGHTGQRPDRHVGEPRVAEHCRGR